MRLTDVTTPDTDAARSATQVARRYFSSALYAHSVRSYLWGVAYSRTRRLTIDTELVYVAAMLHDLALAQPFVPRRTPVEETCGQLAWVFAAAAGWSDVRRNRLAAVITKHGRSSVDVTEDEEGHVLSVATTIDHTGHRLDLIPIDFQVDVAAAWPRLNLDAEFTECLSRTTRDQPRAADEPRDLGH